MAEGLAGDDLTQDVTRRFQGLLLPTTTSPEKESLLERVVWNGWALQNASPELRADREVVLEAVKQAGLALTYASDELRSNKTIVLQAVQQDGCALRFANEELLADRAVVLEATKQNFQSLQFAHAGLREDKDFLLLALRLSGHCEIDSLGVEKALCDLVEQTAQSAIAVPGEEAPILTLEMSRIWVGNCDEQPRMNFKCEASLMSGKSFSCQIPDCSGIDEWGTQSPGPSLNDLAEQLLAELRKRKAVRRIFLNFLYRGTGHKTNSCTCSTNTDDLSTSTADTKDEAKDEAEAEADCLPVSPWDWSRPLSDFLLPSSSATTPTTSAATSSTTLLSAPSTTSSWAVGQRSVPSCYLLDVASVELC